MCDYKLPRNSGSPKWGHNGYKLICMKHPAKPGSGDNLMFGLISLNLCIATNGLLLITVMLQRRVIIDWIDCHLDWNCNNTLRTNKTRKYIVRHFVQNASHSEWVALKTVFQEGLNHELQAEFADKNETTNLSSLLAMVMNCDNLIHNKPCFQDGSCFHGQCCSLCTAAHRTHADGLC